MPQGVLTKTDYQDLMQNPGVYLTDTSINKYLVEKDPNGLPRVRSGGLALTYKLSGNGKKIALRCFHKVSPRREQHYSAISRFLTLNPSPILIRTSYQPQGIRYQGGLYPITLMEWIDGEILGTYVFNQYHDPTAMSKLLGNFQQLVNELHRLKIAHGDLSHSNIILTNGSMKLIDYDGMYVPELKGSGSVELGNRSFQHPGRTLEDFGPLLDRFSVIVIYLALEAISISPTIYDNYGTGREGLLFSQSDFLDPNSSKLIGDIEKLPGMTSQIRYFKQICLSDFSNIPSLDEFMSNSSSVVSLPKSSRLPTRTEGEFAIDARFMQKLLQKESEPAVVIGRIGSIRKGKTYRNDPYAFLNIGVWPRQTFTVVIWSEVLELLHQVGLDPEVFAGAIVSVSGIISKYAGSPQIILESPADIAIITYAEAMERLKNKDQATETAISDMVAAETSSMADIGSNFTSTSSSTKQKDVTDGLDRLYGPNSVYGNKLYKPQANSKQHIKQPITPAQNSLSKSQPVHNNNDKTTATYSPLYTNKTKKDILGNIIEWLKEKTKL